MMRFILQSFDTLNLPLKCAKKSIIFGIFQIHQRQNNAYKTKKVIFLIVTSSGWSSARSLIYLFIFFSVSSKLEPLHLLRMIKENCITCKLFDIDMYEAESFWKIYGLCAKLLFCILFVYVKYIYFINNLTYFFLITFFIYERKRRPYAVNHFAHPQGPLWYKWNSLCLNIRS